MRSIVMCLITALLLADLIAGGVSAGPYEDGKAAYDNGDYETALSLIRPLAEQGHSAAQADLGFMSYEGRGLPQDYAAAEKWLRLGAEQGNPEAQLGLGEMYYQGRGVEMDSAEAAKWYRRAADQGKPWAMIKLGLMYVYGWSGERNNLLAHIWFDLAASHGEGKARQSASQYRDIAAGFMSPDQITEARRLAREWKPKAE